MATPWTDGNGNFRPYQKGMGEKDGTDLVSRGIRAIEIELNFLGLLDELRLDGFFGWRTKRAVKRFQKEEGLTADGVVGPITAKHLFFHRIDETEKELGIQGHYLFGLLNWESRLDPGIQGATNENGTWDRGLGQINSSEPHPTADPQRAISDDEAYDPTFSIPFAGVRMDNAYQKYSLTCPNRADSCSILQHNSPAGARYLCTNGTYEIPRHEEYVRNVTAAAIDVPA